MDKARINRTLTLTVRLPHRTSGFLRIGAPSCGTAIPMRTRAQRRNGLLNASVAGRIPQRSRAGERDVDADVRSPDSTISP